MRNIGHVTALGTGLLVAACGDDGGGGAIDARTQIDAMEIERTERTYVLSRIVIPADTEQVDASKFEFPGSGLPVNKVGALSRVLLGLVEGIPFQQEIDDNLANGEAPQIVVLTSGPLDGFDDGATGAFAFAVDADEPADPSNDFDGTGQFRVETGSSLEVKWTNGTLDAGMIVGEGTADISLAFRVPIFAGEEPVEFPGYYPQIRGTVTDDGFTGVAATAATVEELEAALYPVSSRLLTRAIDEGLPTAGDIKALFDTNDDDMVSIDELANSSTMATLLQPDCDLDGDGTLDHISQGILIEGVSAELIP